MHLLFIKSGSKVDPKMPSSLSLSISISLSLLKDRRCDLMLRSEGAVIVHQNFQKKNDAGRFIWLRAASLCASADLLFSGSLSHTCRSRKVCSRCVSCCAWWGWSSGWTLSRTPGTCAASHLEKQTNKPYIYILNYISYIIFSFYSTSLFLPSKFQNIQKMRKILDFCAQVWGR